MTKRNAVVEHLTEHGPTRYSELPRELNSNDRRLHGVKRIYLSRTHKSTIWSKRRVERVAYLPHHDTLTAVVEFLRANPMLEESDPRKLRTALIDSIPAFPREMYYLLDEAMEHELGIRAEHTGGGAPDFTRERTCPYCRDPVIRLPSHIPSCPANPHSTQEVNHE